MLAPTLTVAVGRAEDRKKGWGSSLCKLSAELTSEARDIVCRLPAPRLYAQALCPRGQFSSSKSFVEEIPFFTKALDKASSLWVMGQKSWVRDLEQDSQVGFSGLGIITEAPPPNPLRPPG